MKKGGIKLKKDQRLTASEISNIWIHYINETMSLCVNNYMLHFIKDKEIQSIFKNAVKMGQDHIAILKDFFGKENFPVPKGFSESDVNLEAPPLFTDKYCLFYIMSMTMQGLQQYGLAISLCRRQDMRKFYYQCNQDSMDLYEMAMDVFVSKGIFEVPPFYSTPDKVDFIQELSYVTDVFGKRRTMNTVEAGNTFYNLEKSKIMKAFILAGQQVCKDKEVLSFLEKFLEALNDHIGTFTNLLIDENFTTGNTFDTEVTDSTVSPFSERLFMFHAGLFVASAISYYSVAAITNMRADLTYYCEKSIVRDLLIYAKFGKLMIKKGWIEKPPFANDRCTS
jgi:hypothetical protein